MVSRYFTDQQVAVTHQDMQQCTGEGREEDDHKLVNMDVNNAGFKMVKKLALQIIYEEGNAFNTFVRSEGCSK